MDQISTGIGIAGNFGLTTATTAPPPVPPRPFVGGTQPLSMSTFSGQVPTSYQPQFSAVNFGNGYYNYYQPSLATSNNFLWPTPNQAQQPIALNLLNVAEESSRNAFRSLDTIVNAFVSVVNMLNSTHNAVFNSFRAVVGVVEQFRLLKHFMISQIFISLLRWARFLWRRLLAVLRLKPRNYASSEAIWTSIKEREAPVTMFNYVTLFFWLVAIGGPFLVYKCIMQAVLSDADSNKWAQGMGEHYTAQALYDFNTSNQNELSFTAFDMLRIAPKSKQPNIKDWLLASNFESSKIGLVPINYVKLLSRSNNETGDTEN